MKRFIIALLAVVSCLLGMATASDPAQAPNSQLRVMSFNIRNSGAKDGEDHWTKRKEAAAAVVKKFNPDLLGMQEVLADQFDALPEMLPDYGVIGVARDDGARKGEWSPVLYRMARFSLVDSGNFWLCEDPDKVGAFGWDADCVRICTWARLKDSATGQEFTFANTHFDHKGKLARLNSAKLLAKKLPELAGGGTAILVGDFNCTELSEPYQLLVQSEGATTGAGLFDSYRSVHREVSPEEASFHGFKGGTAGMRIDWILHTKDLKPVEAEIVRTKDEAGRYPSDHYPVTSVFDLTKK